MHFILYSVCICVVGGSGTGVSDKGVLRKRKLDVSVATKYKLPRYVPDAADGSLDGYSSVENNSEDSEDSLGLLDSELSSMHKSGLVIPGRARAAFDDSDDEERRDRTYVGYYKDDGSEDWLTEFRSAGDWELTADKKKRNWSAFLADDEQQQDMEEYGDYSVVVRNSSEDSTVDDTRSFNCHKDDVDCTKISLSNTAGIRGIRPPPDLDDDDDFQQPEEKSIYAQPPAGFNDYQGDCPFDESLYEAEIYSMGGRYELSNFPMARFAWVATDNLFRVECVIVDTSIMVFGADLTCYVSRLVVSYAKKI